MGFDIENSKKKRKKLSDRDRKLMAQCESCDERINGHCGGFIYESDHRFCDLNCHKCRAFCCESVLGWDLLRSVGGSSYINIPWNAWDSPGHNFWFQINRKIAHNYIPVVIINFEEIFSRERGTFSKNKNLRDRFEIHNDSLIGLSFYSRDEVLEPIEKSRKSAEVVSQEISRYNFDFVFAPNFSVYSNWPVIQNRVNIKRKFIFLRELQKLGISVIPDFCVQTKVDLANVMKWIQKHSVRIVGYTMQCCDQNTRALEWKKKLESLRELIQTTCIEKIVLVGATGKKRMASISEYLGDYVIFLDTQSSRIANYGKTWSGKKIDNYLDAYLTSIAEMKNFHREEICKSKLFSI